jgi:hypothetical protein
VTDDKSPTYKVNIDKYGGFSAEAPTKDECLELIKAVAAIRQKGSIDEAIR